MLFFNTILLLLIRVQPSVIKSYELRKYSASIFDIPHHLVVAYRNLYCSGSLLKSRVAITTASCFKHWNKEKVVVKVGADTITGMGQVIEVVDIKTHEYFGHSSELDNDIALLYIKEHVLFGRNVQKTVLVDHPAPKQGTTIEVSGWGNVEHTPKYANSLLWSEMTVVSADECKERFPFLVTPSNFCARYFPERRLTDNGGSAIQYGKLTGILSYGACATKSPFVALLTNVSYFHGWIVLNTKRLMTKKCRSSNNHLGFDIIFDDK